MQGAPSPVFPIFTASIGSGHPLAPSIGFFGGIHGLEQIGSQVVLDYMQSLLFRLPWDELLTRQLEKIRLVNPVCSTQLAQYWQASHHSHPWAGHDLPHDDGQWVCERVSGWLRK